MSFLPSDIFTTGIFTIWHIYQWHFYHLAYLPMTFLPSGIFTNDIFTFWHIYLWHFHHMAFLPMTFLPHTVFIAGSNHMQLTNTLTRCWADVGPSSLTVGQCGANDGLQRTSFQYWANIPEKYNYDDEPVHESRPIICTDVGLVLIHHLRRWLNNKSTCLPISQLVNRWPNVGLPLWLNTRPTFFQPQLEKNIVRLGPRGLFWLPEFCPASFVNWRKPVSSHQFRFVDYRKPVSSVSFRFVSFVSFRRLQKAVGFIYCRAVLSWWIFYAG